MDRTPSFVLAVATFAGLLAAPAWAADDGCDKNHYILSEPCNPEGTFTLSGSMTTPRAGHTATLLLDGTVLIAGGDGFGALPSGRSAELYDPATGRVVATGSLILPRRDHSATRPADRHVQN